MNSDHDSTSFASKVATHGRDTLNYYTETANLSQENKEKDILFLNLSITKIFQHISNTIIGVINDLVSNKSHTPRTLIRIFFKEDRLIYTGLTLLIIAFAVYIVDLTQ